MIIVMYMYILGLNYVGIVNFSLLIFPFYGIIEIWTSFKSLCKKC